MSDEHDRLLAQGPRVAPEPRLATDDGKLVRAPASQPVAVAPAATTSADNPSSSERPSRLARARSGTSPTLWRRVIPLLVVALFISGRALGGSHARAAVFGIFAVVVVTAILVRKARQL
jgi:hypothetical protein